MGLALTPIAMDVNIEGTGEMTLNMERDSSGILKEDHLVDIGTKDHSCIREIAIVRKFFKISM